MAHDANNAPLASTLIVYPDGVHRPGEAFRCRDGFVARIVSAVANSDQSGCISDAREVCRLLNAYDALVEAAREAAIELGLYLSYGGTPPATKRAYDRLKAAIAQAEG